MANTFYRDAINVDSKMTPFPVRTTPVEIDPGLVFHKAAEEKDGKLSLPHSIMNENVAIN